jgi:transposase
LAADGFEIVKVQREHPASGSPQVVIELTPGPAVARRCGRCGAGTVEVHDTTVRRIRELPILDAETWLLVPLARVRCPACGPSTEALPWLERYARMTKRFAESVARLAQVLPITEVADHFRLKLGHGQGD